jgi:hypothetical protein
VVYDEAIAQRMREVVGVGAKNRKMFGGLTFFVRGYMTVDVQGDDLVARVGREIAADLLSSDHVRKMDFTGRPLAGCLYVSADAVASVGGMRAWVERCLAHTASLPDR